MILKKIKFFKMQGLGNDYIFIDAFENDLLDRIKNKNSLAFRMSRHHYGIGSDGLIFLTKGNLTKYKMEMYNNDGSYSENCGNGLRCLAYYIYKKKLESKQNHIEIQSDKQVYKLYVQSKKDITLNLGKIKKILNNMKFFDIQGNKLGYIYLTLGNPHCVVFLSKDINLDGLNISLYSEKIQKELNMNLNIEYIHIENSSLFKQRTWERGAGETLSCGTGAAAAFISAYHQGLLDKNVKCILKGGSLEMSLNSQDEIEQKGFVEDVFYGYWKENYK